jgi:hypothetical protein
VPRHHAVKEMPHRREVPLAWGDAEALLSQPKVFTGPQGKLFEHEPRLRETLFHRAERLQGLLCNLRSDTVSLKQGDLYSGIRVHKDAMREVIHVDDRFIEIDQVNLNQNLKIFR